MTMNREKFRIISNVEIAPNVYLMDLMGAGYLVTAPGQFINILIDGFYLRRPISIASYSDDGIKIIYKVVGQGTKKLASMKANHSLDTLIPLGNGYDLEKIGDKPLLIGGGVGVPPMYGLADALVSLGKKPQVILGFNTASEVFSVTDFKLLGLNVTITTADGSLGTRGFVTDAMEKLDFDYVCACGPEPMLKAVSEKSPDGQFSFEARMACGFGACMGCSCETKYGYKRICKDGPVLFKEEIIW